MRSMRSALLASLALHVAGLALVATAVRPRFTMPPRLQAIPVDFIALAAPGPALTERTRFTQVPAPALTEHNQQLSSRSFTKGSGKKDT